MFSRFLTFAWNVTFQVTWLFCHFIPNWSQKQTFRLWFQERSMWYVYVFILLFCGVKRKKDWIFRLTTFVGSTQTRLFEGKSLSDIEKSWALLERAEHERERALQEALLRLENLEQLAQKFGRKVTTCIPRAQIRDIRTHLQAHNVWVCFTFVDHLSCFQFPCVKLSFINNWWHSAYCLLVVSFCQY